MESAKLLNPGRGWQAISTTFKGPGNRRGSRIVARCEAMRIIVPCDDSLSSQANHEAAAMQLANKLGWGGVWVCGHARNEYVFLQVSPELPRDLGIDATPLGYEKEGFSNELAQVLNAKTRETIADRNAADDDGNGLLAKRADKATERTAQYTAAFKARWCPTGEE